MHSLSVPMPQSMYIECFLIQKSEQSIKFNLTMSFPQLFHKTPFTKKKWQDWIQFNQNV